MSGELVCRIRSVDIGGESPSALEDHPMNTSTKRTGSMTPFDRDLFLRVVRFCIIKRPPPKIKLNHCILFV